MRSVFVRTVEVDAGRDVERRRMLLRCRKRLELVGQVARKVHVEVRGRHFQERVLAHHRRPVAVEQVLRRLLIDRIDRIGLRDARGPVGLKFLVICPEARELVVLVDLVLAARRVIPEVRQKRVREAPVGIHDRVPRRRLDRSVIAERTEPPEPVLHQWAAGVRVEVLQASQRGVGDALCTQIVGDVVAGEVVPVTLARHVVDRFALQGVAARLRDHVDVRPAAAADLGAHRRRVDRDLFSGSEVHVVHRAVVGRRVGRDAVIVQVVVLGAVRHHAGRRCRGQPTRILTAHRHAGKHRGRPEDRARRRHRREDLVIQSRAHFRVLDVDGRRGAADRDRFLQRGQLQRAVDRDRLPHGNDDPLAHHRREASQLEFQAISSGVDRREPILSGCAGDCRRRAHDGRARQRDGDAGQHAALGVGNLAYQLAECLARLSRGRCETER